MFPVKTDRLILRSWKKADLELFSQLNADLRVIECFPSILTQTSYRFCQRYGYREMSFNDPDGYAGDFRDITIGKCLIMDQMDQQKKL